MKKIVVTALTSFLSVFAFSQVEIELEIIDSTTNLTNIDLSTNAIDETILINVSNVGSEDASLKWLVTPSTESCIANWDFYVCDNNNCYVPEVTSNVDPILGINIPFLIEQDSSVEFQLHVVPNMTPGCCDVNLSFFNTNTPDVLLNSIEVPIQINDPECTFISVGLNAPLATQIIAYPNPTADKLFFPSLEEGRPVLIYNSIGRLVSKANTDASGSIQLQYLNPGIYFIWIMEANKNIPQIISVQKK